MERKFVPKPGQVDYTDIRYAPTINVVVTNADRILVVKRAPDMRLYPGKWDWICGFLDDAKSVEDKAREELEEELGLTSDHIVKLTRGQVRLEEAPDYRKTWFIVPVLAEVNTRKFTLNWEASEAKWVSPADLPALDMPPDALRTAAAFFPELAA